MRAHFQPFSGLKFEIWGQPGLLGPIALKLIAFAYLIIQFKWTLLVGKIDLEPKIFEIGAKMTELWSKCAFGLRYTNSVFWLFLAYFLGQNISQIRILASESSFYRRTRSKKLFWKSDLSGRGNGEVLIQNRGENNPIN